MGRLQGKNGQLYDPATPRPPADLPAPKTPKPAPSSAAIGLKDLFSVTKKELRAVLRAGVKEKGMNLV